MKLDLASCWRCAGHVVFEPGVVQGLRRAGAGTYCARCLPIIRAEERAHPCVPGARCVHVDYQDGPFASLVVQDLVPQDDGPSRVRVFILGFPGDEGPALAAPFWPSVMQGRRVFARGELIMKGP